MSQASKITEPCERALYLPTLSVSSQLSSILHLVLRSIASVWHNHVNFQVLKTLSKGSLSYPLSAISLLGRFFGRPRPARGTLTASRVCSASFTSAGDAEARMLPRGTPWPSTTTIHFVPLPFLVFPTQAPPFLPVQSYRR